MTDLVHLDHHLRRIGRDDEHVGVGLDENARFLLVGLAQALAGLDGGGAAGFQVVGFGDAHAIAAASAEIGEPARRRRKAIHRLGQHLRQGVLAGTVGPGEDDGVGKAVARQHAAQAVNDLAIAVKLVETHRAHLTTEARRLGKHGTSKKLRDANNPSAWDIC